MVQLGASGVQLFASFCGEFSSLLKILLIMSGTLQQWLPISFQVLDVGGEHLLGFGLMVGCCFPS